MNVRKASGLLEAYNPDKLVTSCMNAGASLTQATTISREIKNRLYDGIPTKEIRDFVYAELLKLKPSCARKYMGRTGLRVRTSRIVLESFNKKRIVDSLVSETKLDPEIARKIAQDVEKELIRMKLNYVTAPLIREIVNVKLLEEGLENTRARYTRLGMPVYDVHRLLEHGPEYANGRQYNPELVHKLMADQISREYALLNVLPLNLADAHMKAQINIHDLDYFATRSHSFSHDLRFFLKYGFKPDGVGEYTAISGPPKKPEVAFIHAARVLSAAQTNCGGGQGLNYFNTFMAPYVRGLPEKRIKQLAQMFIFELAQMYGVRGGQVVYSGIDCDFEVPSFLRGKEAVLLGGCVRDFLTYGDFEAEARLLFNALCDVYLEGDFKRRPFLFPKFNVRISKNSLTKDDDAVDRVCELAAKTRTPFFITPRKYSPKILCCQGSSFIMPSSKEMLKNSDRTGSLRGGIAQLVTINLPQIAYEADGRDKTVIELLHDRLLKAKSVLLLKKKMLEKNIKNELLPFMSQRASRNDTLYLNPETQGYVIGFVGLNHMVSAHTGEELHESRSALKYGLSVVRMMRRVVDEFKDDSNLSFMLARTSAEACSLRFAEFDAKRFPDKAVARKYTNSFQIRARAGISSRKRMTLESPFHKLLNGGALSNIPLNRRNLNPDFIRGKLEEVIRSSDLQYYHFVLN
jgi:ribonucleoside-triphosphate reductase